MRRLAAPRASPVVAVVAAIAAVLAVMVFPGISFGQTTTSHGGSPSDVYTLGEREPERCTPIGVNVDGVNFMPLQVEVRVPSHLLIYFSFMWSGLDSYEGAEISPGLDGGGNGFPSRYTGNTLGRHMSGTVMSSFANVGPGTHTVDVYAAVAGLGGTQGQIFASLESCLLTVFVMPAIPA